jgi:hypothetical protein
LSLGPEDRTLSGGGHFFDFGQGQNHFREAGNTAAEDEISFFVDGAEESPIGDRHFLFGDPAADDQISIRPLFVAAGVFVVLDDDAGLKFCGLAGLDSK